MELIKRIEDNIGKRDDKFYKTTLFKSDTILLGLNCLKPGQVQKAHEHSDQDKFYFVFEGTGRFVLGAEEVEASTGEIVWAPAGMIHGVTNPTESLLTLLVGIAPAP